MSSAWSRDSAPAQRLLKFTGRLGEPPRGGFIGRVTVRFKLYNDPDGAKPYWEETQNVLPDARGSYTVLLGETTIGGLPPEIFASRERHWLGVQPAGQPEQARLLLVELPSAWRPDPITSGGPSAPPAVLPSGPVERYLALSLGIMFLLGSALACSEAVKWWKRRMEQFGEPPFGKLLGLIPSPDKLRRGAQVLTLPVSATLRAVRRGLPDPIPTDEQPNKAA